MPEPLPKLRLSNLIGHCSKTYANTFLWSFCKELDASALKCFANRFKDTYAWIASILFQTSDRTLGNARLIGQFSLGPTEETTTSSNL